MNKFEQIFDGGPAFPQKEPLNSDCQGLSLRDYFAAKMNSSFEMSIDLVETLANTQGVSRPKSDDKLKWHLFYLAAEAAHRYMMAEAMLIAREKQYLGHKTN